jgi:hypothetical protein
MKKRRNPKPINIKKAIEANDKKSSILLLYTNLELISLIVKYEVFVGYTKYPL